MCNVVRPLQCLVLICLLCLLAAPALAEEGCSECNACAGDPAFVIHDQRDLEGMHQAQKNRTTNERQSATSTVSDCSRLLKRCYVDIGALLAESQGRTAQEAAHVLQGLAVNPLAKLDSDAVVSQAREQFCYFDVQARLHAIKSEKKTPALAIRAVALQCRLAAISEDENRASRAAKELLDPTDDGKPNALALKQVILIAEELRWNNPQLVRSLLDSVVRLAESSPPAGDALRILASMALEDEDHHGSGRYAAQYLRLFPDTPESWDMRRGLVMTRILTARRSADYEALIPELRAIEAGAPTEEEKAAALYTIGDIRRLQAKKSDAAELYKEVMSKYPDTSYGLSSKELLKLMIPTTP